MEEKKLKHMMHTLERQKEFSKNYGKKLVDKLGTVEKKRFDPLEFHKKTEEKKQEKMVRTRTYSCVLVAVRVLAVLRVVERVWMEEWVSNSITALQIQYTFL